MVDTKADKSGLLHVTAKEYDKDRGSEEREVVGRELKVQQKGTLTARQREGMMEQVRTWFKHLTDHVVGYVAEIMKKHKM